MSKIINKSEFCRKYLARLVKERLERVISSGRFEFLWTVFHCLSVQLDHNYYRKYIQYQMEQSDQPGGRCRNFSQGFCPEWALGYKFFDLKHFVQLKVRRINHVLCLVNHIKVGKCKNDEETNQILKLTTLPDFGVGGNETGQSKEHDRIDTPKVVDIATLRVNQV